MERTLFRNLIGCLRYLTLTRADLVFLVSYLSSFMSKPFSNHVAAAKRILRYVKGTLDYTLVYKNDKECRLMGYCDSDYTRDLDDQKSTSVFIFFYGSKPIAWNCCKQKVIALSFYGSKQNTYHPHWQYVKGSG